LSALGKRFTQLPPVRLGFFLHAVAWLSCRIPCSATQHYAQIAQRAWLYLFIDKLGCLLELRKQANECFLGKAVQS
jgi:hypothetical protein